MTALWLLLYAAFVLTRTLQSSTVCPPRCSCNLTMLNCSGRNLTNIPNIADSSYEVMDFSFNNISSLADKSFTHKIFSRLRRLDFSNNNISHISSNAFVGLNMTTEMSLANNTLGNLTKDVFSPLQNLKSLYLQGNKLTSIPPEISSLSVLEVLDITHNNITEIKNETFANSTKLRILTLMGNNLKVFLPNPFKSIRSLRRLDLQLLQASGESSIISKKSELTQCLCERKKALDWCKLNKVECRITCDYVQEEKYDGKSNVCNNTLPLGDFGKTRFNDSGRSRNATMSDFIWATVITVGVVLLLIITLIMLAIVVRQSKAHLGEEDYSDLSDYDTYRGHITPLRDAEFRWSFEGDSGKRKSNG